ncbi:MAG: Gfo/Idh/MocA family oxidoreductase [Actinomycetota bacterium]|nr:Gfo/Idh/MocA family oxidoreductase [Actinomycetota bacterium]
MTPLKIGILGAARIAAAAIVEPARALGHELVAVAARDRSRAEAFAGQHGVAKVHDSYADLIEDPDVDVVYNALINSLHMPWNIAALAAGKHVLSEKPITANADQARALRDVAASSPGTIVEGFHYLHHPAHLRLRELVTSGALGEIRHAEIAVAIPAPPDTDARWCLELAGGATMDLGCYALHAARQLGTWIGATPELRSADATLKAADMDAAMRVQLTYDGGVTCDCLWDMSASDVSMTWTVTGSKATATSPAFVIPHLDSRLVVTSDGRSTDEPLGEHTSYTYQLAALAASLHRGDAFPIDMDDSVANAELIDACYRLAGLPPRGR